LRLPRLTAADLRPLLSLLPLLTLLLRLLRLLRRLRLFDRWPRRRRGALRRDAGESQQTRENQ
jgi:hypothetical protein